MSVLGRAHTGDGATQRRQGIFCEARFQVEMRSSGRRTVVARVPTAPTGGDGTETASHWGAVHSDKMISTKSQYSIFKSFERETWSEKRRL